MNTYTTTNPAPASQAASRRVLWAIFCKTGYDLRACNLSQADAAAIMRGEKSPADFAGARLAQKRAPRDCAALYQAARAAGLAAGQAATPAPMVVQQRENMLDDRSRVLYVFKPAIDGACGHACVVIKGNTAFGRWAKKAGLAKPHYPTGLHIWVEDFGQSAARKAAYAQAFAKCLRDHGVDAWPQSWED